MSSATSIKTPSDQADGFRPWHFFVIASLMAATSAVVMAREATPEHLVLISFSIGAAGAAGAGLYRMLAPFAEADTPTVSERLSSRSRAVLEREKALVLRSIKELEFDRAMGKLSSRDFDEMSRRLRVRAIALMRQLDAEGAGYREVIERELAVRIAQARLKAELTPEVTVRAEPGSTCAVCATHNDPDASFCKRCGTRVAEAAR
jgi:ribosomal protein L40E